ncbi:DUF6368 family protein [Hahella sp. NBU794]|uniref:DUF6368 family protein n=1 Tax=Hahella sp. NBU794 TaxID=3422590 RepID=UPI003D6F8DF5
MAGPTVGILIREKISATGKQSLHVFVTSISNAINGENFWVDSRPLGYAIGPEYAEEIAEYSRAHSVIGWEPKDIIGLYAMCNDAQDHILLGKVALSIARLFNGWIAFHNPLSLYTNDPDIVMDKGIIDIQGESLISPDLFERWLQHPDFCMVK